MDDSRFINSRKWRLLIVLAGIILGQAILYGPSLAGRKILLPLDILTLPGIYIPPSPETANIVPHDKVLVDLITNFEPARRFASSEIHSGRFPLWAPYQFGGAPFIWPKYSIFMLLDCCTRSPIILAWVQLLGAMVAGLGMYCFCRESLPVGFWPAAVCAWCYPLTAFFTLWQGFTTAHTVYWLPWIFLAVDRAIRARGKWPIPALSITTFLVLTSGQLDIAGQVLLGSGIYAIWCLLNANPDAQFRRKFRASIAVLILGWGIGFLLASPYLLPLLEYAQSGSRMVQRNKGAEERPPIGLSALPQAVLPDMYGSTEQGGTLLSGPNLPESAAAAYAGILATLVIAPLAWQSRPHRAINVFWILLAIFGLSWCLNIPGIVQILRLPGLRMMSHNRLVFLTSFSILASTAIGLEALMAGAIRRKKWFALPASLLVVLFGWCIVRSIVHPEPIATQAEFDSFYQHTQPSLQIIKDVNQIQSWFALHFGVMALFCALGILGWVSLWFQKAGRSWLFPVIAILLPGELLWFGHGRSAQCDPALYYPENPVFDKVAQSVPGRVIGIQCLPASLAIMAGLSDLRGYDAIDPARMVRLVKLAGNRGAALSYSAIQFFTPEIDISPPDQVRISPVLDMLGVRHIIFQGDPPPDFNPSFQGNGYWSLFNSNALSRMFVPKSVEAVKNEDELIEKLASPQFNPKEVAYIETSPALPPVCRGSAQIIQETPTHIVASVQMGTPGMVVLTDRWDKGWRASWNSKPVEILQANYAVRGVMVPSGSGILEFTYRPASLRIGLWMCGFGSIVLLITAIPSYRHKISTGKT